MRLRRRRRRRIADPLRIAAHHLAPSSAGAAAAFFPRFFGATSSSARLLLVRALQEDSRLQRLLHQVRAAALRALLRHRLLIRRKVALRIIRAAPEHVPPPRLALGQVAGAALGALQPFNQVLLHVLALRISRAGDKLPIRSLAQHQRLAAQRAVFARRLRRGCFCCCFWLSLRKVLQGGSSL